jgi:glyceraldehyde 3-phosphate dehydrogenase-like protein
MTRIAINGFGRIGRAALRTALKDLRLSSSSRSMMSPTRRHSPRCSSTTPSTGRSPAGSPPGRTRWSSTDGDRRLRRNRPRASTLARARRRRRPRVHGKVQEARAGGTSPRGRRAQGDRYDHVRHEVISNASCTTNCLAPVVKTLHETIGIEHGFVAAWHLVPTTTGAASAIGLVIPELGGKLHGYAVRVPVPVGSLVDLTVEAARRTTLREVDEAFRTAAVTTLDGVLDFRRGPLVSSDIVKTPFSAVVDGDLTNAARRARGADARACTRLNDVRRIPDSRADPARDDGGSEEGGPHEGACLRWSGHPHLDRRP